MLLIIKKCITKIMFIYMIININNNMCLKYFSLKYYKFCSNKQSALCVFNYKFDHNRF